jgi:prepilin-type N-terminal cleavage/methylation domain-containing protein
MKIRKTRSPGARAAVRNGGFTLVELLVVISVILLLAMLLIPTVDRIMQHVYAARSTVMVRRLHDGILAYKEKTRFLPGEKTKDDSGTTFDPRTQMTGAPGALTGSQLLAACLWDIGYTGSNPDIKKLDFSEETNARRIDASKIYAEFKPEFLFGYSPPLSHDRFGDPILNSISDGFPKGKTMPICYFLASNKLADNNKPRQFQYKHNNAYLDVHQCESPDDPLTQTDLETWLTSRGSAEVLNNGEFVLIAAGIDRDYLVDTLENPQDADQPLHEADKDDIANDYSRSN